MQARNLADEQVGETVPGPTWLYPRHTDAVRPLRTQGAQNIRTRGSLPQQRSNIRPWLSIAHQQFSACRSGGVHIRIYACSRTLATISKHCPCKAGWVHICDQLSGVNYPQRLYTRPKMCPSGRSPREGTSLDAGVSWRYTSHRTGLCQLQEARGSLTHLDGRIVLMLNQSCSPE